MTDDELRQLVASNSRSIQALSDNIAELTNDIRALTQESQQAQAERAEFRQAMIGIANLLAALDDDRPTIFRRLIAIETKIDRLLEQNENTDQE